MPDNGINFGHESLFFCVGIFWFCCFTSNSYIWEGSCLFIIVLKLFIDIE